MLFPALIRDLENAGDKMEEEDKSSDYEAVIVAIETMNTDIQIDFVKSRSEIKNENQTNK